jgi:hypothetical protein
MLSIAILMSLQGCVVITHQVTTEAWVEDGSGMYMGYLEMKSLPFTPVKSYVQWCKMREDNSLDCMKQTNLEEILNP